MNIMSDKIIETNEELPRRGDVFVEAFAKGLAVINAFNPSEGALTLSEVAKRAQLPPASTRRLLYTLVSLGYARIVDKRFELCPKVLDLGFAYLASLPFRDTAHALLDDFARDMGEVCTVSVLDTNDVIYIMRAEVRTQLARSVGVGGRLAAHATSSGLILLASLDNEALESYLEQAPFEAYTNKTRNDAQSIRNAVDFIKEHDWMLSSEELELGVCGLAVPIRNRAGQTVAALGLSVNLARYSSDEVKEIFLRKLQDIAQQIGRVF